MIITLVTCLLQGTLDTHSSSGGAGGASGHTMIRVDASADWKLTRRNLLASRPVGDSDHCLGGGTARALVRVGADFSIGDGYAADAMPLCDVQAASVGTASYFEHWVYQGEGRGYAGVAVNLSARGLADLKNADCAAAALGYATFESLLTPLVDVFLDRSAGETETDALGAISLGYKVGGGQGGLNIPVTIGRGEGRYPDVDVDQANCPGGTGDCCTNEFWLKEQTEGQVRVWADGGWLGLDLAECEASMCTCISGTITLTECP